MKNQKGITLVALIITIIVMLILAGVSISLVVGDNGVMTQAQNLDPVQEKAFLREAVAFASTIFTTDYYADSTTAKTNYVDEYGIDLVNSKVEVTPILNEIYKNYSSGKYNILITADADNGNADSPVALTTADNAGGTYRLYLGKFSDGNKVGIDDTKFSILKDAEDKPVYETVKLTLPVDASVVGAEKITGPMKLEVQ